MKNFNTKNLDTVADLVSQLEKLNQEKLEIMDEGSAKAKAWTKIESHIRSSERASCHSVVRELRGVRAINPSAVKKAYIKEVVMEYVESVKALPKLFFAKRFVAAATMLVVLFFVFVPGSGLFPSVYADKNTYVSVEQGVVEIVRDGEVIPVEGDRVLVEGDTVRVADGSLAQIFFLDDSRAALGPGSEVYMHKLYADEENESDTEVEVLLEYGEMWVQVINLFSDDDYFSVLTREGEFRVNRAADLNVQVNGDVDVQVASQLVSFVVPLAGIERTGILGEGSQLTIAGDDELIIEELTDMTEDIWWNYNLVQSENHIEKVTEYYITESANKARLVPENPLQTMKDTVSEVVTFGSYTNAEKSLEDADETLAEAEQLISEGDDEGAEEKIEEYIEIVEDVVEDENVSAEDLENVEAHVDEATKALSVKVADNEDLSVIQEAVDQVEEIATEDEGEKSLKKFNNASNKLTQALSLVGEGKYDEAMQYLQEYGDEAISIVTDLSDIAEEDRVAVVSEILDRKIENLQVLKIIIEKLDVAGVDSGGADEVKSQVLFEVNALVVSLKERAITTLTDFLESVQSDENIQVQALSNLKKSVPLDFEIMQKINDLEEVYFEEGGSLFLMR